MLELKTKEDLLAVVAEAVDPVLKRLTAVERKYGVFPGVDESKIGDMTYQEKFCQFLRAMVRGRVDVCDSLQRSWASDTQLKAMTDNVDTAGGYLVPEEFRAEVVRLIPKYGLLRRFARTLPMGTDTLRVPRQTASVSVTWPGEGNKGTNVKPSLGQVLLNSKTMVGLCTYSLEFLADAGVPVLEYLQTIFAEEFAAEEDNQWIQGTGVPFLGVLKVSGTKSFSMGAGDTTIGTIVIDDLIDLMDQVEEEADEGAIFVFHKKALSALRKVKVTSDYALAPASQGLPATIAGVPYYTSKKAPSAPAAATAFAFYGNPRYTLLGDRQQMTIAIAKEGTIGTENLFEQNLQGLRITERIAVDVAVPDAYSILKTAAS